MRLRNAMKIRHLTVLFLLAALLFSGCTTAAKSKAQKAVDEKNPELCKELSDDDDVKKCYSIVAEEMDDPKVCLNSTDAADCVGDYAVSKESTKHCDLLTDDAAKYGCIVRVTGDQTGRAIDQILQEWRGNGTVNKCKEQCRGTRENCVDSCVSVWESENMECIGKYARDSRDYGYCEGLAKNKFESCKSKCYNDMLSCETGCEQ